MKNMKPFGTRLTAPPAQSEISKFFFSLNEKLKIIVCTWNYAQIVGIVETNNFYK